MIPDKETDKKIWEHNELALMCNGDGWKIVRKKLIDEVIALSDILEINEDDPTKLSFRLAVNREVIKILLAWLKEIEGEANDESIGGMLKKEKTEAYLTIIS